MAIEHTKLVRLVIQHIELAIKHTILIELAIKHTILIELVELATKHIEPIELLAMVNEQSIFQRPNIQLFPTLFLKAHIPHIYPRTLKEHIQFDIQQRSSQ